MKLRDAKLKSSWPEVFYKKGVSRIFAKFTGKHLCQRLFLNKVAGLAFNPELLYKKGDIEILDRDPGTGVFL